MLERIMGAGIGVYILWGLGAFAMVIRMILNSYLGGLVKASQNMAVTRKKKLKYIRQKYENGRTFGLNKGSAKAFTEKNIRTMKLMGVPLEQWKHWGKVPVYLVCMILAGSFLYYDTHWIGSRDMIVLLANGVMVCAFMLGLENIFLITNKMEILKANIQDYLENLRERNDRKTSVIWNRDSAARSKPEKEALPESSAKDLPAGELAAVKEEVKPEKVGDDVLEEKNSPDTLVLDSFLKEFFT